MGSAQPGPSVQTHELEMVYRRGDHQVRALDGVSIAVPPGQFLLVRGRSGSGKSTLLHLLAGLHRPTSGAVVVGGEHLERLSGRQLDLFRRRNVGLIFQFFNLIPALTVDMNIALPLLLDNRKLPELADRIDMLSDLLGISHRRGHLPRELSGGEMQRVAIARALLVEPRLILADEPTGNLDSIASEQIFTLLREVAAARGVTTVVMTHEVEATSFADRVIVLHDGRVAEDTAPGERVA